MENCSRPNSGTVSRIQLKLSTGIDHQSGITWQDSGVKRSKVKSQRHVTYRIKNCNNSITGSPIKFILGASHEDDPPTSKGQYYCHDNAGCLATGPPNLHFMASYNQKRKCL